MNREFWAGKRVLLTGHTGFKGSWLSLWLQELGADVVGYSLDPPTEPCIFDVARVADGMSSIIGDIRDLDKLLEVFDRYKPEIVFHLAAQPIVLTSYEDPVETYTTNIIGTVNLLEAARLTASVQAMVNITSDKCYENKEWVWGYRENEPMGGHDPYSSSKGCAELVTAAYQRSFFSVNGHETNKVAVATARAGNVVGGGDWADNRLIPDFFRAIDAGGTVVIRNPDSIRPWQHVLEPLYGYLSLAERLVNDGPEYSEPWNFGPHDQDARPVSWILDQLVSRWGEGASWELDSGKHRHEASCLKLDCSKSRSRLNWASRLNLQTCLEWIIEWHKAYKTGSDMRAYTENQINHYENLKPV